MRLVPVILAMMMFASASAQSDLWTTLSGSAENYANQRAAVHAAIEEFTTKLQAALATPNDGLADHYASQRSAVNAIVDRFVSELKSAPEFDARRTRIVIVKLSQQQSGMNPLPGGNLGVTGSWSGSGFSGQMGQAITDGAAQQTLRFAQERLQHLLPRVTTTVGGKPDPTRSNLVCLALGVGEVELINRTEPFRAQACQGRLMATFTIASREQQLEARFENQGWADDFSGFLRKQPRQNWIIGRSNALYATADEAMRVAGDDAVSQLVTEMRTRALMNRTFIDPDALQATAMSKFQSRGVADKFVQHVDNGTALTWCASVLVQSEAPPVQASGRDVYSVSPTSSLSRPWSSFRACMAMMIVVIVLYAFLRLLTRGRSTPRSGASPVALVMGIAIFMLFAMLFYVRVSSAPHVRAMSPTVAPVPPVPSVPTVTSVEN